MHKNIKLNPCEHKPPLITDRDRNRKMPDRVESDIQKILKGEPLTDADSEICDFTLAEQNAAMEAQGVEPIVQSEYVPTLGANVTYVVVAVLLNDQHEVLMIQEAKESCAGKWYLPAGRMEQGETICDAARREVLEETGLEMECTTLLMIECAGGSWIRFIMTGNVIGGQLKTPAQADRESLQAKWVGNLNELSLRSNDILPLIGRARLFNAARLQNTPGWHNNILPGSRAYNKNLVRLIIVIKKKATNKTHVLLSERTAWHLPTCEIHPTKSLHSTIRKFMVELFGAQVAAHKLNGILSVEHKPPADGLCFTLLVAFRVPLEEVPIIGKCVWHEISDSIAENLLKIISTSKTSTFQLNIIR